MGNPNWKAGGPSPNPSGRSKAVRDASARFAQRILESTDGGEELLRGLLELLRAKCFSSSDHARRLRVIELLLERAYGRSLERVDITTSTAERPDLSGLSNAALAEIDAVMQRHLAAEDDAPAKPVQH